MRLLCYIGLHSYERHHAGDGGGFYNKCRRCGRERDIGAQYGG
jgi:hypothetical protein